MPRGQRIYYQYGVQHGQTHTKEIATRHVMVPYGPNVKGKYILYQVYLSQ